jgi:hypothetical protein
MSPNHVPIPERMAALDRDRRGYPIPYVVQRDKLGQPHFTVNDSFKVERAAALDLCGICGQKLMRGRWFVGGPGSAFHEHGAYIDGPLHRECCAYALKVCPYLAAPNYAGRIDGKTLKPGLLPAGVVALLDPTMDPSRPAVFVAIHCTGQKRVDNGYFKPRRPYLAAQVWRQGEILADLTRDEILDSLKAGGVLVPVD